MKVKYNSWCNDTRSFDTVKEAVQDALTPSAYSYEGTFEGMIAKIEKLQEMVASLVESIYGEGQYRNKVDQLIDILGYSYEVEE